MATIAQSPESVNSMTPPIDADRLRRDHGLRQAAQLLADATRIQQGLPSLRLGQLDPDDREWFAQTARHAIEVFELVTQPEREPDAVREKREQEAAKLAAALEARMAIERSRGAVAAADRGHDMGPWHGSLGEIAAGVNRAVCHRCRRAAQIALGDDPVLSGSALTEGCIVAAGTETL